MNHLRTGLEPAPSGTRDGANPVEQSGASAQASLDHLVEIRDYERKRLGQELHDVAGQLLTSLQFSIARLRQASSAVDQDDLIDEISNIVTDIDQEIRALAFLEYPAELRDMGLGPAVQSLSRGFGRRTGIDTRFKLIGEPSAIEESAAVALLRVTQEALTNVHRHARASRTQIILDLRPGHVQLTISDNGVGISDEAISGAAGIGLNSMRQRIEAVGGRFSVRAVKDGTRISVKVPVGAA